jgi:hypothetical protein
VNAELKGRLTRQGVFRRLSRRQRSGLAAVAVAATLAVSVPPAMELMTGKSLSALDGARSFLGLMQQRSPGARTQAQLTKQKSERLTSAQDGRKIASVARATFPSRISQSAPVSPVSPVPLEYGVDELAMLPMFEGGGNLLAPAMLFLPSGGFFPPGVGGGLPGVGGVPGGAPGGPGGVTPPGTPNIPPAVPEPATWLMMLLGFGMLGLRIRGGGRRGWAAQA